MSLSTSDVIKIGEIIAQADGGCPSCVAELAKDFINKFEEIDFDTLFEGMKRDVWFCMGQTEKELRESMLERIRE